MIDLTPPHLILPDLIPRLTLRDLTLNVTQHDLIFHLTLRDLTLPGIKKMVIIVNKGVIN